MCVCMEHIYAALHSKNAQAAPLLAAGGNDLTARRRQDVWQGDNLLSYQKFPTFVVP